MKISIKGITAEKAGKKFRFEGMEIEVTTEEVALHFEHLTEMRDAFDHAVDKALVALEAGAKMYAERHKQRMEELEKQDENDAAYHQRRQEQEVLEHQNRIERENLQHQHWVERYGKDEDE